MTATTGIVATVVLCALIAASLLAAVQRRHRLKVQALLERLADFEQRHNRSVTGVFHQPSGSGLESDLKTADDPVSGIHFPLGNDPLSGKTSEVGRVVARGQHEATSLADQAIICVHRHLEESFTAGQMADELYVSIRTLERGMASTLECSPSQLITAMKMREAKRLLSTGTKRVNEVAMQLEFSSPEYFSRRFKSIFGVSPSQYLRDLDEAP